jgi:hypothetical protein
MLGELGRNRGVFGERIIFLHSGGIFGLLAKGDELLPQLRADELSPTVRLGGPAGG